MTSFPSTWTAPHFKHEGRTRKQVKAKARRTEAAVKKAVRAACVERDGRCRVNSCRLTGAYMADGVSEWAHLHVKRRSKTRGLPPEERHTTAGSLILRREFHDAYDGRTRPRLIIEPLTDRGADGPLKFTYGGRSYEER